MDGFNHDIMRKAMTCKGDWGSRVTFAWVTCGVSLLLRLIGLSEQPMHHDESLHAFFAANVASGHPHEYQALLHGPLIYYLTGVLQLLFGLSDFVSRMSTSLVGAMCAGVVWFLPGRLFTREAKLLLAAVLTLSPYFLYYSRFLRSDIFVAFSTLCCFLGFLTLCRTRDDGVRRNCGWGIGVCAAVQFVAKENAFIHLGLLALGLFFSCLLFRRFRRRFLEQVEISWLWRTAAAFLGVFVLFYSSFFQHPQGWWNGVLDGAYRESLVYWWNENRAKRIDGEFTYHFPILFHYESLVFCVLYLKWCLDVRALFRCKAGGWWAEVAKVAPPLALACLFLTSPQALPSAENGGWGLVFAWMHVSSWQHVGVIFLVLSLGSAAWWQCLRKGQDADALLWFFWTGCVGAYSYVGEKVPWLGVHILLPSVLLGARGVGQWLLCCRGFRPWLRQHSFWAVGLMCLACLMLLKSLRLNYFRQADPEERIVYTQTTPEAQEFGERVVRAKDLLGRSVSVVLLGDPVWPFAWTFRAGGLTPAFSLDDREMRQSLGETDVVIVGQEELSAIGAALESSHQKHEIPLRAWWVPPPDPPLRALVSYYFLGPAFQPQDSEVVDGVKSFGYTSFYAYVKNDLGTLLGLAVLKEGT